MRVTKKFNGSEYDIWTERGCTKVEQFELKKAPVKYYCRARWWKMGTLKCMVTNERHSSDNHRFAHLDVQNEGSWIDEV